MGQRANLVIVTGGDWRLFYDHWCANRLDVELFWGPELARAFIEQRRPLQDRNDWLDEVWCEGGAVLNEDRRQLVWFGGEDVKYDVPLRRAFLSLMQHQWPGWDIRWAPAGIVDLGASLGFPEAKFLSAPPPDKTETFHLIEEYPEDNNLLLTVRTGGVCSACRIAGDEEALELGEAELATALGFERSTSLEWSGDMPLGGVHLDLNAHVLHYWRAAPAPALERRVRAAWPNWKTVSLGDRFEDHLRIAALDVHLPLRPVRTVSEELIGYLGRHCTHASTNPARELGGRLGATNINPWTDEARPSVGAEAQKIAVLDTHRARLAQEP